MENEIQQRKRTLQQNRSLHKYCTEVANELNGAGVTMKAFVKDIQVDHTMESVKNVWRAIAREKFGKSSTANLSSKEITQIYEEVNRHLASFGLHISFPSEESRQLNQIYEKEGI